MNFEESGDRAGSGDLVIGSMRRLIGWMISIVFGTALVLLGMPPSQREAQAGQPPEVFTEGAASKLLIQVAEGLQGHSPRKMLGAFDLSRMDAGPLFKEQITAFFNQYDSIRVHFKLVEVTGNAVTVDAEMDATPPSGTSPPQHKSAQLRLTAAQTKTGWKIIELQPRSFFS